MKRGTFTDCTVFVHYMYIFGQLCVDKNDNLDTIMIMCNAHNSKVA